MGLQPGIEDVGAGYRVTLMRRNIGHTAAVHDFMAALERQSLAPSRQRRRPTSRP